jgi:serine/threonine protein kinase
VNKLSHDDDYVAFTRRLLDDLAAGRSYPADHYAKLFPGAADAIRADLEAEGGEQDAGAPAGPPARIGAYEVTGEMPGGGMGQLLLARHPGDGDKVVIKTAKPGLAGSARGLDRLKREAAILGRLDHDRICPVTDVVIEGERVFVVMPFFEGETLEARLGRAAAVARKGGSAEAAWIELGGGLPAVLSLLEEVARAIHTAHEKGVVHRDLKPANILVRPDGHPMVLDFGLAVDLSASHVRRLTVRGDLIGTPSYMAPEQVRSELEEIDRRTDVYALGVILYELLTFRRAFKGPDLKAIGALIVAGRIDPPSAKNPEVPRDLEAVCLKAMAVRPRRRYATALELAEDLLRARTRERTVARPVSGVGKLFRRMLGA